MLPALNGKQVQLKKPLLPPPGESGEPPAQASIGDLDEARLMLSRAARVIRAQEQRILQLEKLALTDALTGLANRRAFLEALEREMAAARRDPAARGALVMIDLDGFKLVNDELGHAAGDDYLRAVGQALLAQVRGSDLVARMGGDEFAILLARMDEEISFARLARLEAAFHAHALPWNGRTIPLRGSFGLAAYKGFEKPEAVMAAADFKLYARKPRRVARV